MKMRMFSLVAVAATIVLAPGCLSIKTESAPVAVTPAPAVVAPARTTVVTTLPSGYRTRVYRGSTYYYTRNTYYRTYPSGGYVVVERPW